jgi:Fe-S cluster assembly protein SufD
MAIGSWRRNEASPSFSSSWLCGFVRDQLSFVRTKPQSHKGSVAVSVLALPTRRDEAFRYSDIGALGDVWPIAQETIIVSKDSAHTLDITNTAPANDVFVRHINLMLESGARSTVQVLNAGGRLGRIVLDVTLHDGADFALHAVQLGSGNQTVELITTVRHIEPNATSNQQVRQVLSGQATGSYLGKVAVARDAQKSDSVQSVKAMLLDRTATANAKPELEIYADDVKCAHGATVGELDQQAMFEVAAVASVHRQHV